MCKAFSLLLSLFLVSVHQAEGAIEKSSITTDSTKPDPRIVAEFKATPASFPSTQINTGIIKEMSRRSTAFEGELGFSKQGRPITAYYFPGRSEKRALVIGGMHGSELSGIEVARKIVADLQKENRAHYSVIIIPCLFPDNEALALQPPGKKKQAYNTGRYTHKDAADPNRQMPALGKPFDAFNTTDYLGREIEHENQVLLHLISAFMPHRIANIHAIRDILEAGIFADPRTDSEGYAMGFGSDSSLAIGMAKYIYENGGNVAGNRLDSIPTALYYNDPFIVQRGDWQPRNLAGSLISGDRGQGVSLGSWASTSICDSINFDNSRQAMRLITVEFPGYKRPADYPTTDEQEYHKQLVDLYASSIESLFLGPHFEEEPRDGCDCMKR